MNQLVTPNLNVPTQIAKCLKYVQDAFGSPNAGRTATVSWNTRTLYRHFDREFPTGVYFLGWFDYWATIDGSYENFGHVVICKDGVCYSSPYRVGQTSYAVISSISEVERIYGCTFVGWSEDIAGLKVIEGDNMQEQIDALNEQLTQTNKYVEIAQGDIKGLEKQLDNTNKAVDTLTARVLALETSEPVTGEYVPYTGEQLYVKG